MAAPFSVEDQSQNPLAHRQPIRARRANESRHFRRPTYGSREIRVGDFWAGERVLPTNTPQQSNNQFESKPFKANQTFQIVPLLRQCPRGSLARGKKKPALGRARIGSGIASIRVERESQPKVARGDGQQSNLMRPMRMKRMKRTGVPVAKMPERRQGGDLKVRRVVAAGNQG